MFLSTLFNHVTKATASFTVNFSPLPLGHNAMCQASLLLLMIVVVQYDTKCIQNYCQVIELSYMLCFTNFFLLTFFFVIINYTLNCV
jgi:hypothetical protein